MRGNNLFGCHERMPDGSLRTAVPEPFWIKRWPLIWKWRPACYECRKEFKTREEHSDHYIMHHAYEE